MKVNIGPYPKWYACPQMLEGTFLESWWNQVLEHRSRTLKVHIDRYDTWSMDYTLSHIITPMLKQLKETKQGSASVDDCDVPEWLHGEDESVVHAKWDYVLDLMIEAFDSVRDDTWMLQYYATGEYDKLEAEEIRLSKGFELFGKYYRNLWD
jgi:hypothetical protein